MARQRTFTKPLLGAVLIAIVLLGGPSGVVADVGAGSSGVWGYWEVADRATTPGVDCEYRFSGMFRSIKVRPPLVFARDEEAVRESQYVSWRFNVERSVDSGPWVEVHESALQKLVGYDDAPAAFRGMRWPVPDDPPFTTLFRVKLSMYWYRPIDHVEGAITRRLQHYVIRDVTQGGGYVLGEEVCPGKEP